MPRPRRWFVPAAALLIVLAGAAAYHNSFAGPFIFDDTGSIIENPTIRRLWPIGPALSPPGGGAAVQNRPIVNLSLAVNYALGGLRVGGYHAFNLAVHLLVGLALFGVIRRTLSLPAMGDRLRAASGGLALACALIWIVHPLTSETVTYVIQRAESMMALFYLLTAYCVLRGAQRQDARELHEGARGREGEGLVASVNQALPGAGPLNPESKIQDSRSLFWFVAAVAACAVGMGCKEAMVTTPVLVLIFDRVFLARSWRGVLRRRWGLYAGLAGTWSVLAWLLIGSAGSRGSSAGFGHGMAWWQYAVTQFGAILHYLRLSVWPDRLAVDYGAALARGFWQIGPQAAAVAVLGGLTGWGLWRRPGLGFLGAWFFVVLAPSSSVVPLVTQTMAEKRVYLPLAAVVTLAVVSAWWGWGRVSQRAAWLSGRRGRGVGRAAGVAAVVGLAGLLGWRTTVRNVDYRSSLAIWQSAAENAPGNPRAYNNAGRVLLGRGEVRAAMRYFDRALKADRGYAPAWSNRGVALARRGDYDGAIRDLDRSIELDPGEADSFVNRGGVWLDRGDYDRAIADLDEAIRLNPRSAAAFNNRGKAHRAKGERAEAIGDFSAAIRLDGDFADAYCGRALALADGGGLRAAIGDYTRAIELEPGLAAAYSGRGDAWFAAGENDRAIRDYSEAIRLAPTFAVAYNNRGAALLNKGHPEAAVRDCTRAIELAPGFAQANSNRAKALLRLGDYDGAWADVRACLRLGGRIDPRLLDELRRASGRDQ